VTARRDVSTTRRLVSIRDIQPFSAAVEAGNGEPDDSAASQPDASFAFVSRPVHFLHCHCRKNRQQNAQRAGAGLGTLAGGPTTR